MKIFKKISLIAIIFSILLSTFPVNSVYAVDYANTSNFTPGNRATIEYKDGVQGLNYTSFNNFLSNPNIPGAFKNDERQFIIGKNCGQSTTDCGSKPYYNTLEQGIKEGDTVRFAVYFHNNGGDPYVKETSVKSIQDATNVKIGVIFDKQDPNPQFTQDWLRPQGYIYADNNQYRTTISDANSVIKDTDGNVLRKATDDMAIMLLEQGLYMEPIKDSAWLWNKNANFDKPVKVGDELTFIADSNETPIAPATKDNLAKTKVTAINYSPTEMSISFDRLPGCFRYSGFVYFDVKVVKKPEPVKSTCTELKVTKTEVNDPLLSPLKALEISATPTFGPDKTIPANTEISWDSTDKKTGKFWRKISTAVPGQYKYTDITGSGNATYNQAQSKIDEKIYYTGYGEVSAQLVDATTVPAKPIEVQCTDKFTLTPPVCSELKLNYPFKITAGVISDLMGKATMTEIDPTTKLPTGKPLPFVGQIQYWVDNIENGKFYTEPPAEYPYINQGYKIQFSYPATQPLQGKAKKANQTGTIKAIVAQEKWTHFVGLLTGKDVIHIQAYDPTNTIDVSKCKLDLPVVPPAQCTNIKVNKNLVVTEGQVAEFSAIGIDSTGKPYNGKITYSVPTEYGTFYTDPNDPAVKAAKANTSQIKKDYDETNKDLINDLSLAKPIGGEFCSGPAKTFKEALKLINADKNLMPFAIDTVFNVMYKTIPYNSITNLTQFASTAKYYTPTNTISPEKDPNLSDAVNPLNPDGQTTQPKEFGTNNVFESLNAGKLTKADKTKISELNKKILKVKAGDPQKGSTITVDPNTKVYFVPTKGSAGKPVISILTECTSANACSKSFDIAPAPVEKPIVCEAAGVTVTDTKTKQKVSCLKNGEYFLNAGFYTDKNSKTSVSTPSNISVKWESTDPNGVFTDTTPNSKIAPGKSPFVASLSVKYVGEGKVTATLVALSGKPYTQKACSAFIAPCTKYCASLLFSLNGLVIPPNSPAVQTNKDQSIALSLNTKDNQDGTLPPSTKLNVQWNTNGTITDKSKAQSTPVGIAKMIKTTIENLPLIFSGADKDGQITVTVDKTDPMYSAQCKADLNILKPEEPLLCKQTTVILKPYFGSSTVNTLVPGEIYEVKASTQYSKTDPTQKNIIAVKQGVGAIVPVTPATKESILTALNLLKQAKTLTSSNTELAKMTIPSQEASNHESVFVVTYSDSKTSLSNAITVNAKNFSTLAECSKAFPLIYTPEPPVEIPLTCSAIDVKDESTKQAPKLTANAIYEISAATTYSKNTTNKNIFRIDPTVGTLVEVNSITKTPIYTFLKLLQGQNNLTSSNENLKNISNQIQTVENGKSIYVVTYKSDSSISVSDALVINAENFSDTAGCKKTFPLEYTVVIPPEPKPVCEDLTITNPKSPWKIDSKSKSQLFEIDVTTTPKEAKDDLIYVWEVKKGGKWSDGETTNEEKGLRKNTLKNAENGTTVEVYALGENGKKIQNCSDTISAIKLRSPEMTKSVYVTEKDPKNTTKDLLNIGASKKKDVTYRIQFAAKSAESVDIWESAMKNGKIKGDKDGNLSYKGMIINVTEGKNQETKYTILRHGSYDYNLEDEDRDFTGYKNDLDSLQTEFACSKNQESQVCIDSKDFASTIENDFKNGNPITFENLDSTTVIEIKIQMRNNTNVTTESCKKYSKTEGCGEEFNNKAKFEATMPDSADDKIEKGSASAKVIVICPYVLTRQAGDVFFYDVLDTGIDVSRCSEVKSTPGLVIQPEKKQINKVPKTGKGDIVSDVKVLDVPSHDICRYSNTGSNVEGYNDILSNFSSTICEMRADVAETWKETYINEAVKANVERISRFGENLKTSQISAMQSLKNMDNAQSGVFVRNGDLEIGTGASGTFEIKSEGDVPAGQTYIIKGGTLHITSNIKYGETDYANPDKIPSAAFIVIDGNIVIDNHVGQIDAIVMAIDTDESGDGKITNATINNNGTLSFDENDTTDRQLVINGSLIGNVVELFKTRVGAGDPTKDEGSVTVRYDERILLNTPPGLSDLLNVTQSLIPG